MSETILVVGGTGRLGEPVARKLAAGGHNVRILSRNKEKAEIKFGQGFTVVQGDVDDAASLEKALEGCTGAHISLDGHGDWDLERRGAENVAKTGSRLGLKQVTLTSGASACKQNAWFPMTRAKLAAESAIQASGIPFTIFRCTWFMEMLLIFVRNGKATVIGKQPARWHFTAADDYAAMVVKAFATPAALGKIFYVYGPEELTMEQALEKYRAICVPEAKLVKVPFFILSLLALLPANVELRRVGLPLMKYFSKVREIGDSAEADAILGKPPTTLEAWCKARAAGRNA